MEPVDLVASLAWQATVVLVVLEAPVERSSLRVALVDRVEPAAPRPMEVLVVLEVMVE